MTRPHNMPQGLIAKIKVDAESEADGMQVMHISAASEINNLLLPSLEMLRARTLCLTSTQPTLLAPYLLYYHVLVNTRSMARNSFCA